MRPRDIARARRRAALLQPACWPWLWPRTCEAWMSSMQVAPDAEPTHSGSDSIEEARELTRNPSPVQLLGDLERADTTGTCFQRISAGTIERLPERRDVVWAEEPARLAVARELSGRRHVCGDDRQPHREREDERARRPGIPPRMHRRIAAWKSSKTRSSGTNSSMPRMRESLADAARTVAPMLGIFGLPATTSLALGSDVDAKASRSTSIPCRRAARRSRGTRSCPPAGRARSALRLASGRRDRRRYTSREARRRRRPRLPAAPARVPAVQPVMRDQQVEGTPQEPSRATVERSVEDSCGRTWWRSTRVDSRGALPRPGGPRRARA